MSISAQIRVLLAFALLSLVSVIGMNLNMFTIVWRAGGTISAPPTEHTIEVWHQLMSVLMMSCLMGTIAFLAVVLAVLSTWRDKHANW